MASVVVPPGTDEKLKSKGIDYSKFANIQDSDEEEETAQKSSRSPSKTAVAEKPTCLGCGVEVAKPLRCGKCQKAVYCSAQCQRSDWLYHKRGCSKPEEKAKPKAKPSAEKKADRPTDRPPAEPERREEKIVDNDAENLTWYRHREWKPTAEPKAEFKPVQIKEGDEAVANPATDTGAGSAWNAAGTWEDRDVTALAKDTFARALSYLDTIDVAGGVLMADDVTNVEGEASKPVIRGKLRHMFDFAFNIKFHFMWMDSSGQHKASGSLDIADFTNDAFIEGGTEPEVRFMFSDAGRLDSARKQAIEEKICASVWPPREGSLMGQVAGKLRRWVQDFENA